MSVSSKRLKKILRHNFAFHQNVGIERWLQNSSNARFTQMLGLQHTQGAESPMLP